MKKKIAIITTHRANNYGAQLQSYALTHKINELGADCEILDYRCPSFEKLYHSSIPKLNHWRSFLALIEHKYIRDIKTTRAFNHFRTKFLKISNNHYNASQLKNIENLYDAFIAGSDQIWNPRITTNNIDTFDKTYLLNFIKNNSKKFSYAASIGISEIHEALSKIYYSLLKDFNILTIREHKGTELLKQILNRDDITTVIDPVLLLTENDWITIENPYKIKDNKYILVYSVGGGKDLEQYASEISIKNKCTVYYIQPPVVGNVCKSSNNRLTGVGPREFIWLFRNSQEIITTSFHGTALGLLFGKKMHILKENNKLHSNSRFDSLLNFFEISDKQATFTQYRNDSIQIVSPTTMNKIALEIKRQYAIEILLSIISII